jgi:colanic acid/amylovoran biosynthesis glycosyltransferase
MRENRSLIYVLDRFPSDTLNFIYNEIEALEAAGFSIELHSLLPAQNTPEEARPFLARTDNLRPLPLRRLLAAWGYYLLRRPAELIKLMFDVTSETESPAKLGKSLAHLAFAVAFAHRVRDRREHIHAHFAFKASTAALAASRLNGNSYSLTAHGSATLYEPERFHLGPKVRGARFIVAVSEYNRRTLLRLFPDLDADRIVVNHCGIRLDQFPYAERTRNLAEQPRIACVASLYPVKNHETLLAACARLAERGVAFRLDLIGKDEGGRREWLEALAADLGIAERLRFHGVVDHGEVARLLAGAACCVLSSHSEGIPVSLMEAMALGVPVLGPRVTGVPELVEEGESGLLADPADPEDFAAKLALLLGDQAEGRRLAAAARLRIEARFDIAANSQQLANIIDARLT